jgi:hypothetical protein
MFYWTISKLIIDELVNLDVIELTAAMLPDACPLKHNFSPSGSVDRWRRCFARVPMHDNDQLIPTG